MARYAFTGGTVIDATGRAPIADGVVLVEGDRIAAVGRRGDFPTDMAAVEVACAGCSVLPGLVNSHLHLALTGDDEDYADKLPKLAKLKDRDLIPLYAEQARTNLDAGVTTVRDLHPGPGGTVEGMKVLQEQLRRHQLRGSRVFVALRPLVQAGGHGSHWLSRSVSGADEVRRAVRENVAEGSDFIKIMTAHSWGPLPGRPESWARYLTVEELRAGVEVAHRAGRLVAAHAHGDLSIGEDLEAGIDSIEHGSGLTDELIGRMVRQGTFLVPTLASYEQFTRVGPAKGAAARRVEDARYVRERQRTGVAKAIAAGVKIAAGTDAGFQYLGHGETLVLELEMYVELGMKPLDAIRAATARGAELLQQGDAFGTLEPGKLADVIVAQGDVLSDIGALRRIRAVMRDGVPYKGGA